MTALFVGSKGARSASELTDRRALTDRRLAVVQRLGEPDGGPVAAKLAGALEPLAKPAEHGSAVDATSRRSSGGSRSWRERAERRRSSSPGPTPIRPEASTGSAM